MTVVILALTNNLWNELSLICEGTFEHWRFPFIFFAYVLIFLHEWSTYWYHFEKFKLWRWIQLESIIWYRICIALIHVYYYYKGKDSVKRASQEYRNFRDLAFQIGNVYFLTYPFTLAASYILHASNRDFYVKCIDWASRDM